MVMKQELENVAPEIKEIESLANLSDFKNIVDFTEDSLKNDEFEFGSEGFDEEDSFEGKKRLILKRIKPRLKST